MLLTHKELKKFTGEGRQKNKYNSNKFSDGDVQESKRECV